MSEQRQIKVAIHGAGGRMGLALIRAIDELKQQGGTLHLVAAIDHATSPQIGKDAGALAGLEPLGVLVTDALMLNKADVLIDFSRPEGCLQALAACVDQGCAFVSGTTGLDERGFAAITAASEQIAVLHAMNFSLGVAVMRHLAEQAARMLGEVADIEIIEAHHRHKVDAPSGTALAVGESIASGLGEPLADVATWARHGDTGPRQPGSVGFSVIRGGDIVGEHTAMFCLDGERVEISHRATDRMIFARGAVRAAEWVAQKPFHRYTMSDILTPS